MLFVVYRSRSTGKAQRVRLRALLVVTRCLRVNADRQRPTLGWSGAAQVRGGISQVVVSEIAATDSSTMTPTLVPQLAPPMLSVRKIQTRPDPLWTSSLSTLRTTSREARAASLTKR